MEILKCYEGGNKEEATKWEEISRPTGGSARVCVRFVSFEVLHLKFFMAELNFRAAH
jgi:hypothetical protein